MRKQLCSSSGADSTQGSPRPRGGLDGVLRANGVGSEETQVTPMAVVGAAPLEPRERSREDVTASLSISDRLWGQPDLRGSC